MTWPNFLAPWWGLLGLLAVPLVLLYILRQKRPDLPVSSTLLWSKALADMRASTPFQKLRRNLLLLLQLLILAALVFTLMRPVVQAKASQASAGVIVIDATASMQTRDGGADESRLDRAKAEARKLVDAMRPGDRYMLIADGGGMTQVRSGFSTSKSELHGLIDSVRASDAGSDLSESLLLAATSLRAVGADGPGGPGGGGGGAGARTEAVTAGKVWLFSDGAGVKVPDALGGGEGDGSGLLQFVRIGSSEHSVGVTRLSITPVPKEPGTYQVFVGLKNGWAEERRVGVALAYGDKDRFLPDQAKFVTLGPGATGSLVFEKVVADPGRLYVRVDDRDDDFPLDNTAYGLIAPPRKVKVLLVTAGNPFLENLVTAAVKVGAADGAVLSPEAYDPKAEADLVIFDGLVPAADRLPKADTLLIRPRALLGKAGGGAGGAGDVGDLAGFRVLHAVDNPPILRWRREDPLMQYVELNEVRVAQSLLLDRDPAAVDLVSSPEGPLIAYKDFGPVRRYLMGFSPLGDSNWVRIPTLIIFMQNVIEQTRVRHFIGLPELLASGTPAKLWDVGNDAGAGDVHISLPDGGSGTVPAHDGTAEFGQTDQLGFYDVAGAGGRKFTFAVNLLNVVESDIRPRSLQTTAGSNVQEAASVASVNKEVWRWLAAAALVVLLVEWWVYHRRIA